jgi:hypothetical protein
MNCDGSAQYGLQIGEVKAGEARCLEQNVKKCIHPTESVRPPFAKIVAFSSSGPPMVDPSVSFQKG